MTALPRLPLAALLGALLLLTGGVAAPAAREVPVPRPGWHWPVGSADDPPRVLEGYDPPALRWSAGHRGVDLATTVGAPVRAAGPGVVGFAGPVAGRGVVTVLHPAGVRTTYEPVAPAVRPGTPVAAGDVLGTVAADGHCGSAACLHWGALRGRDYLDPLRLLRPVRVRLLPHDRPPAGVPAAPQRCPPTAAERPQARGWACW